ncbi:sulfotransferase [Chloroflexota bacterium]
MIESPVLIIGCPRSGTTLLFNILSEVPSLWSLGRESKDIIERYHHPRTKNWVSGELDAADLTPESESYMIDAFQRNAAPGSFWRTANRARARLRSNRLWTRLKQRGRTRNLGAATSSAVPQMGRDLLGLTVRARNTLRPTGMAESIRLLEKTPENCLRLPFMLALYPDARIIYLTRDGRSNVSSLIEGWKQPHLFPGYRVPERLQIAGYTRERWAFTLVPGWRDMVSRPLEEVCAWQWIRCNEAVLAHKTETAGQVPYLILRYEELVSDPQAVLLRIADFIDIDPQRDLPNYAEDLPQINVVSAPDQDKWRQKNGETIGRIQPLIEPMMQRLGYDSSV